MLPRLPKSTEVKRVIPKNAFDKYTNTYQKKAFTDFIKRITWTHKLSRDTVNLEGKEIPEIQVFHIELKVLKDVSKSLEIIDRAIPYPILFILDFDNQLAYSISKKHSHPTNPNAAVIDWTFRKNWFEKGTDQAINIQLRKSLDWVFKDLCTQLSTQDVQEENDIENIVSIEKEQTSLLKEISLLEKKIKACKQFNQKVELNQKLIDLKKKLMK